MLLFRCITGESWNGIMHDIMEAGYDGAALFFAAYMTFVSYLLFELPTAIILDEYANSCGDDDMTVPPTFVSNFTDCWVHQDPLAKRMIPLHRVVPLLVSIRPYEDGATLFKSKQQASIALTRMNMATVGEAPDLHVHYIDAIGAVVKYLFTNKFGDEISADLETTMVEAPGLAQNVVNSFPDMNRKLDPSKGAVISNLADQYAAVKVRGWWL